MLEIHFHIDLRLRNITGFRENFNDFERCDEFGRKFRILSIGISTWVNLILVQEVDF